MKKINYLALSLAVGILACGCSDENELSTQNRGKEKPVVTLTAEEIDGGSFTFTIAASAQASQYAYAILEGTDNPAPLAYDIVCDEVENVAAEDRKNGNYSHYAFNVSDAASATHTFECKPQGKYEVFAAAITSTGLLGEVTKLSIEIPKIELKAGNYTVSYADATYEFSVKIELDAEDPTKCLLYADWFGLFGSYSNPILVGQVDPLSKEVVFDGTFLAKDGSLAKNEDGSLASAFSRAFYKLPGANLGVDFDCLLVFFGGGNSGTEPIVASMDNNGYLTDIASFEYDVFNAETMNYVGVLNSCTDGIMTYVPEGGDTPETQAHAAKKNVAGMEKIETPRYGFRK